MARLLSQLRHAVSNQQPQQLQLQLSAHSLKSASATFGALHLTALCKELEFMGRARTLNEAGELVLRVEAEYATGMVPYAKLLPDHMGNPVERPVIFGITVSISAAFQVLLQMLQLMNCQTPRTAKWTPGLG